MNSLTSTLLALSLAGTAGAADYYLSQDGDDRRDGTAPERSWRSLERVPVAGLKPGDRVLLRGGDRFLGSLQVTVSGEAQRPITIASWGTGQAMILPPPGSNGLTITDAGNLVVRDLLIAGPGADAAVKGTGVYLHAAKARSAGIVLRNLTCSDFPVRGIELWSDGSAAGFDDVLVERVVCHGSGEGGMGSWDSTAPGIYAFRRIVVRDSLFHGNRGRPAKRDNHSGNGIILGGCQDALIERCAAWGNGDLCNSTVGGPVGIWLCESDRSTIRACVSFRNRTGIGVPDGGGFDLDGGCTNCVIDDCLSWRNDGAGYLVYQYKGARPLRGNIIRNCFSIGDGRTRNNGGIYIGADPPGDVHQLLVERCTVVMDPADSKPAAVHFTGPVDAFRFERNLFISLGGADLLNDAVHPGTTYAGNRWVALGGEAVFRNGSAPAGDSVGDSGLRLDPVLPVAVDVAWLARLVIPGVGAVPIPRYGPAAY